jgi:hypothetical protein
MIMSAYFIGSSYEYRRNPEAKAVAARIQRYIKTNDTIGSHIQAVAPAPAPASVARTAPSPTRTFPSNSTLAPGSTHQRESKPPATPSRVIVPAHLRAAVRPPRSAITDAPRSSRVPIPHESSAHSQSCEKHTRPATQFPANTAPGTIHTIDFLEDAWAGTPGTRSAKVKRAHHTRIEAPDSRDYPMPRPRAPTGSAVRQPQRMDQPAASLIGQTN